MKHGLSLRRLCSIAWIAVASVGSLSDCVERDTEAELGETSEAIVYGNDDRVEVYQSPSALFRQIAQTSAVALLPLDRLQQDKAGDFGFASLSLANEFNVCLDQRFATEQTVAECSGVLIDDDLVLTAAHCFESLEDCANFALLFGYYFMPEQKLSLSWGDIYGCRRVVARELSARGDLPRIDYAVVQLDRVPIGRAPVQVRTSPLTLGEEAAVIGCPSGLPLKIDTGGEVLATRSDVLDYFILDSDTFQGSSGSGVFDQDGLLIGTLVRGGDDYTLIPDGACNVPNVVTTFEHEAGTPLILSLDGGMVEIDAEEATYVRRAIDGLCASGWPSERLCSTPPRCGDGYCSASESRTSCPADCACAYGACLDGGNYPAAAVGSRAYDKSHAQDGGCSAHGGRARSDGAWLTLAVALLLRRSRRRA